MRSSDYKSLCQTCGEEYVQGGNYRVKILPGKTIPKKALKMSMALKKKSTKELSKFQKYMLRKTTPYNTAEITCGTCSAVSQIQMKKPGRPIQNRTPQQTRKTPTQSPFPVMDQKTKSELRKLRRQSKTPKDAHAGLYIPPELLSSKANSSASTTPKLPFKSTEQRSKPTTGTTKFTKGLKKQKIDSKAKAKNEQRGISNLKKILFKSKQRSDASASTSASSSFQSFLSDS